MEKIYRHVWYITHDINTCMNKKNQHTCVWYMYEIFVFLCLRSFLEDDVYRCIIYICGFFLYIFSHLWQINTGAIHTSDMQYIHTWDMQYIHTSDMAIHTSDMQHTPSTHQICNILHIWCVDGYAIYTYDINTCTNLKNQYIYAEHKYVYCINMICSVCIFVVTFGGLPSGPIHTSDMKYFKMIYVRVHMK